MRARACARLSEHLVSVPAATLSAREGVGDEREFIGSLLSTDCCAPTHTHANTRTHAQMTRVAAAAAMHKDTGLAHRLTDVALALHAIGCDCCPCPTKPMLCQCQYLVLIHSPDACSHTWSASECESSLRVLPRQFYKIFY